MCLMPWHNGSARVINKNQSEMAVKISKMGITTLTAGPRRFIITETSPVQKFAWFEVDASFLSLLRLTEGGGAEGECFFISGAAAVAFLRDP